MPCCLIKFALFLIRRRAGRLAKIPVVLAEISANCEPTRGLAPEDRSRNFMEDVNKQATTKISFSFWTLIRLLGAQLLSLTYFSLSLDFVNRARSFDMTNGTICFRQENLFKGNWWVLQHLGMKIGHTPPWNHRKKNYRSCILYDLKPK